VIEEIKLKDFPWHEMHWACVSPGVNELKIFVSPPLDPETPVLILWKNSKAVAYVVFSVWSKVDYVEIYYVETQVEHMKKGYATKLMNCIFEKYGSNYEMHADKTDGVTEDTLKRWGFRQQAPLKWIREKEKREHET
jgi:hypothetical protein